MIECPDCEGAGGVEFAPTRFEICDRCGGSGEIDGAAYREEMMEERSIDDARDF